MLRGIVGWEEYHRLAMYGAAWATPGVSILSDFDR